MKYILQFAIGAIALFVTYASVYGLGMLFHTIMVPIIVAGTALELGKYVAISYAYQQWDGLKLLEKFFLSLFISMIMAFTSVGVFSYLGQGYQTTFATQMGQATRIAELDTEIASIDKRVKELDAEAARAPDTVVTNRIKLIQQLAQEKTPLVEKLNTLKAERSTATAASAEAAIHAGPIEYLGRVTGWGTEKAATWIIAALTVCLDPFAISMTVLLNRLILVERRKRETEATIVEAQEPVIEKDAATEPIVSEVEALVKPVEANKGAVPEQAKPNEAWWNHEELTKALAPFEAEPPVVNSDNETVHKEDTHKREPPPAPHHLPNPGLKHIDANGHVVGD